MKLARFATAAAGPQLGLVTDRGIVALDSRLSLPPGDMTALIAEWDQKALQVAGLADQTPDFALRDVTLLAPIASPGKILGIGLNYADHAAEADGLMEIPKEQMWFSKPGTAVNAPFGPIELPRVSQALDYEAELVVVIGQRIRHASPEQAKAAIFGYCAGNDVSVRDWQFKTSQVMIGKSFDTHAPFGPWITLASEVDAQNLDIRCLVNGEQRQSSNTRYMIFDCLAQIAFLSQAMTLEPGDILFTGTPSGVAAVMKPPRWLKVGDVVRVEIDGIGEIENRVVRE